MFNELLIQNGLARITVFESNTKYLKKLHDSKTKAKSAKKGIWSNQNAIKGGYAPKPAPAPAPVKKETFKNCTEMR